MAVTTLNNQSQTPHRSKLAYSTVIFALLSRDLAVLKKTFLFFIIRVIMQPMLFVFVFTYVFPKIGQGVGGGGAAAAEFSTLLVAGVVGISIIFQAIQAVALPLVQEFGYTKEIEDRALAPIPVWGLAIEKILSGALQALLAAIVVFPIVMVIPATPVHLQFDWPLLLTIVPLAALLSGALGLTIGTLIPPNQVPLIFAIIVLPITFLGAVYYPWSALTPIEWLKVVVLVNPLIYINEGLRAALTRGVPHMELGYVYLALIAFTLVLLVVSTKGLKKRIVS